MEGIRLNNPRSTPPRTPVFAFLALSLVAACGGDDGPTAARPPGSGGGSGRADTGAPPKPPIAVDDDAGTAPMVQATLACERVDATRFGEDTAGEVVNATALPSDFSVTRVSIGPVDDCETPAIVLIQSGGRCPDGDGHELVLTFDAASLTAGRFLGQYVLGEDDPPPLQIRYKRPEGRASGTWGTCGDASGTVSLVGTAGTAADDSFEGEYEVSLTACDDGAVGTVQTLRGSFAAHLEQGVDEVCGDR